MKLTRITRTAGWLAVAGLLGAALVAPTAMAADGANPTSPEECGTAYAYYFKIQAPSDGTYESGDVGVETNWPGQVITILNAENSNQTFDWASTKVVLKVAVKYGNDYFYPTIAPDGLSGTVDNDNQNGISHVTWCGNPETTTTTTTDETTDTETTQTTQTTQTSQTTQTTQTTTTATGTVASETGGPTPPSTDTVAFAPTSSSTGSGWGLLLVAAAGLLAAVLLLTPATAARKR